MRKVLLLSTICILILSCNCETKETSCDLGNCGNDTTETINVGDYRKSQRELKDKLDSIRIMEELEKQGKEYFVGDTNKGI